MFIQCGACGLVRNVPHTGTPKEIEQGVFETIKGGWRYVKSYDGYICPSCIENNPDKLYEMYVGKPKPEGMTKSYRVLLNDMARLLKNLKEIDQEYGMDINK